MYSGTLRKQGFIPDQSAFQYAEEREEYIRFLKEREGHYPPPPQKEEIPKKEEPKSLMHLLEMISPEDSALVSLIIFLLCDNTENDVVLLGILLYVLLSK